MSGRLLVKTERRRNLHLGIPKERTRERWRLRKKRKKGKEKLALYRREIKDKGRSARPRMTDRADLGKVGRKRGKRKRINDENKNESGNT